MSDVESGNVPMVSEPLNEFGSSWTEDKANMVFEYAKAYLTAMKNQRFQLLYFDGFAGSGDVQLKDDKLMESVALRVMGISEPRRFDRYVMVELGKKKATSLREKLNERFPDIKDRTWVIEDDCNAQLRNLSEYLKANTYRRVLAFLDPCGMQVDHAAVETLKDLHADVWILFPSGIGANRNLFRDVSKMKPENFKSVERILGITEQEIRDHYYEPTLFEEITDKRDGGIERTLELYRTKLQQLFKHVSKTKEIRNSAGGIMYHLLMASQEPLAIRIADHIIKKYSGRK